MLPSAERARHLSAGVTTSLTAVLAALRWGAVMIGLAWAATLAAEGDRWIVVTLSVAIFITSWRTITPIRFGEDGTGKARIGEISAGQDRLGEVRVIKSCPDESRPEEVRLGEIRPAEVHVSEVHADEVRADEVRADEVPGT